MKEIRKKKIIIIYKGDFQKLEKFGFELSQEENQYTKKVNTVSDGYQTFYETIFITNSRIIKSRLYNDLSDFEWTGYVDKAEHYIKDLENAGLLEFKEIEHYKKYIEKLQKENEKYKRLSEMNLKNAEEFKNNMCEHRCLLKSENEKLQKENEEKTILLFAGAEKVRRLEKENEELKGTLRDTQNSWFEDTKKMEKLKNQNQCYINSIQSIAPVLIQEYIEKQEIKDKIGDLADTANKINDEIVEELKSKDICQEYLEDKRKELGLINRDIKTLQSLLDESEEK